jgi:heterotetrameric sarcosine oxidase gamma subunit
MREAGITIEQAEPRSIAGIGAFHDRARLLAALRAEFGIDVPVTSRSAQAGEVTLSCLAPERFLASGQRDASLPVRLAKSLQGLAAVTDQSDMWALFVVSGATVREVLARIVPVNVADEHFRRGDVALTRAGHLDVRLWRTDDDTYELSATRSFAADLNHILHQPE